MIILNVNYLCCFSTIWQRVVFLTFWNVNTVHSHMIQKPQNWFDINNKTPRKLRPVTSLSVTNFVTWFIIYSSVVIVTVSKINKLHKHTAQALLETLTVVRLVKNTPTLYKTQSFLTVSNVFIIHCVQTVQQYWITCLHSTHNYIPTHHFFINSYPKAFSIKKPFLGKQIITTLKIYWRL